MDKTDIIFNLAEILGCEARKYEPLSKHTTFKRSAALPIHM